jgi:acyl-CoA reductase-like NAD-dependent aldehyde dehydrogenase
MGAPLAAVDGATLDVTNPATGERIGTISRCGERDVDAVVRAAETAQLEWRSLSPVERGALVSALADAVEAHGEELARLDAIDNGSPISCFREDVGVSAWALRYFAGLVLEQKGETLPMDGERLNFTLRQPYGVVARITPFNHPVMFAARGAAAPLVAGNAVVIKPSEHTSLSTLRFAELAADVLPPGLVGVVTGLGGEAGAALVCHPSVARVGFTGSVEGGRTVLAAAASVGVKHVTCELGGKNPLVIMPDADLDEAVAGAVKGMNFTWSSQSCGSTSRVLVQREVHDEFVARLGAEIAALRAGSPLDETTTMGALVNRAQHEKVLRYIAIGREQGAREVVCGGPIAVAGHERGLFVRPAVFDDVAPDSRLAQEEIFGPVLSVLSFDDLDDAVRIANDVRYGLTAGIFTRDLGTALRFARDVEAGYVWVNDSSRHIPGASFGGWKASGIGREEGFEELLSYGQTKNVNVRFA